MKIKELTNAPKWLLDAIVRDEDVTIDDGGRVQWHRGEWLDGNFRGGDFWGGDFRGGDFWGANFSGEKLKIKPLCLYGLTWRVIVTDTQMEIGCQRHTHDAWSAFTDAEIRGMDGRAEGFWSAHKVALLDMCAAHADRAASVVAA